MIRKNLMGEKTMYASIFARSFSRYDQKKLGFGAFLGSWLIALSFCTVFKPYFGPISVLNTMLSMVVQSDISRSNVTISNGIIFSFNVVLPVLNDTITFISSKSPVKPICHVEKRTEFCEMNGDIRVNGKSSTVFMSAGSSRAGTLVQNTSWVISPYARKGDKSAAKRVTKWSIKSGVDAYGAPLCDQRHSMPAIIFSLAGYAGNNFHDYSDIIVPLYLTSRQFDGDVKFLITNIKPWWINKFRNLLQKLSRYELVDIDKVVTVHCFTSVNVGLKRYPKELKLNPSESPYSMKDFRQFLRSAYSLKKENAIKMRYNDEKKRPRILILSRKKTRAFTNTNAIAGMARGLGYKVVVAEADSNVARVAEMVNSCDVMMGVHGAGLTNMVYLPENAILIQVVRIGGFEWLAKTDFDEPSKDMNLRYLEYKIKREESSLIQDYPADDEVLNNPHAIAKQGWHVFKSIYLQKQNITLDINRFRPTLLRALELLHQ